MQQTFQSRNCLLFAFPRYLFLPMALVLQTNTMHIAKSAHQLLCLLLEMRFGNIGPNIPSSRFPRKRQEAEITQVNFDLQLPHSVWVQTVDFAFSWFLPQKTLDVLMAILTRDAATLNSDVVLKCMIPYFYNRTQH